MTVLDGRTVTAPSVHRGRRRSDVAPAVSLPDWLDAPLLPSEDPRDGEFVDPQNTEPGDYVLEFHNSTGTASWLRVHAAPVVVEDTVLVTCGRGSGVTLPFAAGRQAWVLKRADAAALAQSASDRVLRPWGDGERAMEELLRSFESHAALVRGWPFGASSLADAITAWDLLRASDAVNRPVVTA